jgi:hypothetical protein
MDTDITTTYSSALLARLRDADQWPGFSNAEFLDELDSIAEVALARNTIEGYLAAILIYQQLTEEMLRVLIDCSDFLIQVAVHPAEIAIRRPKKRMFGQLLGELDSTVRFAGKDEFADACRKINETRIDIVHQLTRRTSVDAIGRQAREVEYTYQQAYAIFDKAYDEFRVDFHSFEKDSRDWDSSEEDDDLDD